MNNPISKLEDFRPPAPSFTPMAPTFILSVAEMVARVNAKREFFAKVMRSGEHYGCQPGAAKDAKPALLKAGAELLLSNYGMSAELLDAEAPDRDYDGSAHGGVPLIAYRARCRVYKQIGPNADDRVLLAQADGFCSSRETKYRYREGSRKCVTCNQATIIKGKVWEDGSGGGWVCYTRRGGCGEKYPDYDTRITSQQVGRIENPDIADVENTVLKMSQKRAYVAATLLATGCSDIFTQDVEDMDIEEMQNVTPRSSGAAPSNAVSSHALTNAATAEPITEHQIATIEALWAHLSQQQRYSLVVKHTGGRARDLVDRAGKKITSDQAELIHLELKDFAPHETLATALNDFSPPKTKPPARAAAAPETKPMIDDDVLRSLAGNVPMIDMRMLAAMGEECGMGENALRAVVKEVTGRSMLTSGTFGDVRTYLEHRLIEQEEAVGA